MKDSQSQGATMSVEEAAEMLGIGRQAAYQAARRGELPVLRLGKRFLVVRAGLEKMLTDAATLPPRTAGGAAGQA